MNRFTVTIFFCWAINLVYGQQISFNLDSLDNVQARPKIGLALSGGAAHGLAHIGVIQYLDEMGIDVDYVTGTSMGAIIGALYSMGYSGTDIEEIAKGLDWDAILNNEIPLDDVAMVEKLYHDKYPLNFVIDDRRILLPQGFLNTNKLEVELAKLFAPAANITDFNDLPRPFKCFGVDIETGNIVPLENGRLAKALRASMAIPSVFAPKYYQGRHLVDGGLMRNFPVSDNFEMGSDLVIGSYVGREKAKISDLKTLIDILTESAFMMSIKDSDRQKDMTNILMQPDVKDMGVFAFEDYEIFIQKGYQSAKAQHKKFEKLASQLAKYAKKPTESLVDPGFVYIDSIKINEMPEADKDLVLDKFGLKERSYMTFDRIEEGINRITATLNFESVSYDVVKHGSEHFLHITAKPREEQKIGVTLNHYSITNSSLILNAQIRNLFLRLSNLRVSLRLSENVAIAGEYFVRGGLDNKNWVFGGRIEAQRYDMIYESLGRQRKNGFMWEGYITPYMTYELSNHASIRGEFELKRIDFKNELRNEIDINRYIESGSRAGLTFTYDNRDTRILTKKGTLAYSQFSYGLINSNDVQYTTEDAKDILNLPLADNYFEGEIFISHSMPVSEKVWWTLSGDMYYKSVPSILDHYTVGGTTIEGRRNLRFIGYREQEIRTDQHLYARSDLRIGLFDNISVAVVGNVIVGESKTFSYSDINRDYTFTAYGVGIEFGLMLPIGPLIFDIGYNSEAKTVRTELSIGWKHFF